MYSDVTSKSYRTNATDAPCRMNGDDAMASLHRDAHGGSCTPGNAIESDELSRRINSLLSMAAAARAKKADVYEGRGTLGHAPGLAALFQQATIMNTMPSSHTVPVTLRAGNAPGSLCQAAALALPAEAIAGIQALNHEEAMAGPQTSSVTVRPRHAEGKAVVLTVESIRPFFQYRQIEAANILGIAPCSLRQACQQLEIGRWPWRQLATKPSESMLLCDDDGWRWKRQNVNSDGLLDEALDAL